MDSSAVISPLERTLPLQVAERIGSLIVEEKLTPGERLTEVILAESFEVSRTTIREALRILEQRKLVSIVPQRGATITKLSRKELEDLYEIRGVLLGLVSRRVAFLSKPEIHETLRRAYEKLRAALGDANSYARASADLVATLSELCENPQLANYIADFALRIGRYARLGLNTAKRREQSFKDWKKLLKAIEEGKPEQAEMLHRQLSAQNLIAALAELERRERAASRPGKPMRSGRESG